MKTCFIVMPITTRQDLLEKYSGDEDHFSHVLDSLFIPALEALGLQPIPPSSSGSEIIHADIIDKLSKSDLVLCDVSALNPNVFFELGIRTALDKPVALVIDNQTEKIPFDTAIINYHKYDASLSAWSNKHQIKLLADHIDQTISKQGGRNSLWKYFGISQTGNYRPEDSSIGEKIDLIARRLEALEDNSLNNKTINDQKSTLQDEVFKFEKTIILDKLNEFDWNISLTATALGMTRPTLYDRLKKYNISQKK